MNMTVEINNNLPIYSDVSPIKFNRSLLFILSEW
jgi:hypothetical protein